MSAGLCRRRRSRLFFILVGLATATPAAADVTVEIVPEPASNVATSATGLSERAGGEPLRVLRRSSNAVVIVTTVHGFELLSGDSDLATVRLLSDVPAAETGQEAGSFIRYVVRLIGDGGPTGEGVPAQTGAAARTSAVLVDRRAVGDGSAAAGDRLGPGTLMVRALGADGGTLSERIVPDPRFVRFETADRDGDLRGRREFIKAAATLVVDLPETPGVTRLAVLAPPAAGRSDARPLATVDLP